jgi:biotin transport system substrate-specific component
MTRRLLPRDLALIALFAALIVVLGLPGSIPVPGMPVPIILQNLGIFLAASILGPRRAVLSVLVFLALAAIGLPVLSGGYGGIGVFATSSLGYFIGWVLAAAVIGWIAKLGGTRARGWWLLGANIVGGALLVDFVGATISVLFTGIPLGTTYIGSLIFLPGDFAKAIIATLIAVAIGRAYPVPAAGLRRGENPVAVTRESEAASSK